MNQIPYHREQASKLLDTGGCDLPLDYNDVAGRVARNPMFAKALQNTVAGDHRLIEMITMTAAAELCREQESVA